MDRRTRSLPVASTFTFGEDRLYESVTVYEPERKFVKTGLLDQYGDPIFRNPTRYRIGFWPNDRQTFQFPNSLT